MDDPAGEQSPRRVESRRTVTDDDEQGVDVGLLVERTPEADGERLRAFTERMTGDIEGELEASSAIPWRFHPVEVDPLPDGRVRRPSAFIDDASLRITEGPYDVFVVVTDAPLVSHRKKAVAGLASPISRIVVVSTRKLLIGTRDVVLRSLDSPAASRTANSSATSRCSGTAPDPAGYSNAMTGVCERAYCRTGGPTGAEPVSEG